MNVVLCQTNIAWEDREANFERISNQLAAAEIPAQSLVVLPEMFATGFSMNVEDVAEAASSQAEVFLHRLAQQYDCLVIASWPAVRVDHWLTLLRARAIENQAYWWE